MGAGGTKTEEGLVAEGEEEKQDTENTKSQLICH